MKKRLHAYSPAILGSSLILAASLSSCKPAPDIYDPKTTANPSASLSSPPKPRRLIEPVPSSEFRAVESGNPAPNRPAPEDLALNETDIRNAKKTPRMIVFGDSIMAERSDQMVSKRINELLGSDRSCRESLGCESDGRAKGGQLIRDYIFNQFKIGVVDPDFNMVVVQGGVNDILYWITRTPEAGRERSFDKLISRFKEMMTLAKSNKKVIVLVTMTPWRGHPEWTPMAQEYTDRLNSWMKSQRWRIGVLVADPYPALAVNNPLCEEEIGMMKEGYRGRDHLHPNGEGRRAIAEVIVQTIGMKAQITQPVPLSSNMSPVSSSPCPSQSADGGIPTIDAGSQPNDAGTGAKDAGTGASDAESVKNPINL